ncbi:inositol phospholipid synthesis and fat-storage-inducing TM-domain-containing protein [Aspergillus coremiiformis]|uniref:Acyl-coenzyme A diphosphatase SCS3 n=1 Tax=Aspergillus coremiiformis TaxID=138285 RepID=A0A5N6YVI0_9EURO|nr:inositol phospholipid synthesis and fat-storage-inducing TM-domain-containing protein [Aspergillus coremiiformis]
MPSPDGPSSTTTPRLYQPPTTALLIYPATLIVGSLFSVLSPTAQGSRDPPYNHPTPLTPSIAADVNLPQHPVNYFARKDNVFNVYFVKIGWLWITAAFASLLFSQPTYTAPSSQQARRIGQALARYSLTTLVWYLTTQWFFGPAIIDRSFVITGGKCENVVLQAEEGRASLHTLATATACKSAGGAWRGGHDVSGHVFMLVLATAMLAFETIGALSGASDIDNGNKKSEDGNRESTVPRKWSVWFVGAVVGLSWWMLLMTAIWFHTWFEKFTGLLIALGSVYTIYLLPRRVIPWRDVVGIPGV